MSNAVGSKGLFISALAGKPARRAAGLQPIEALRYE